MKTWIGCIALIALCGAVRADGSKELVKVSCDAAAHRMEVTYDVVNVSDTVSEAPRDDKRVAEQLEQWRSQGWYEPTQLRYECRLADVTYRLMTDQGQPRARGFCGASPPITLSLLRNDEPLVDQVVLGEDCRGNPSVMRLEVASERRLTLCVMATPELAPECEVVSSNTAGSQFTIPITPAQLAVYADSRKNRTFAFIPGDAAKRAPEDLVRAFIHDYKVWNDRAVQRTRSAEPDQNTTREYRALLDGYCGSNFQGGAMSFRDDSSHDSGKEKIVSVRAEPSRTIVTTRYEGDPAAVYEYHLIQQQGRWYWSRCTTWMAKASTRTFKSCARVPLPIAGIANIHWTPGGRISSLAPVSRGWRGAY